MGYIGNAPYQGVLTGGNIQDGTVETTDLADGAVTTGKINDQAVTPVKMHNTLDLSSKTLTLPSGAVGTGNIADGAVTAAKLAAGAAVPSQSGQSGKYLTTDGTTASWATVDLSSKVAKSGDTMTGTLALPTLNATTELQINGTTLANNSRVRLPSGSSNPSSPSTGDAYLNSSTKELRIYTGTEWGYVVFAALGSQQNPYASIAAAQSNGQATGLAWFKNSNGDAQQLYYDSADGGWILVASNDQRSSVLPTGTSRNSLSYTLNRNGTMGAIGTPDPNSDYIIGAWINNYSFSRARCIAFGRGSTNGTYSFTNRGTYVDAQFNTTSRSQIVARANVSISGNDSVYSTANYWCVDGIQADYNADGSIGANSNQTTIGMVGVNASSGDPTSGCYFGHGDGEDPGEGYYSSNGTAYNCQGYTTWVR